LTAFTEFMLCMYDGWFPPARGVWFWIVSSPDQKAPVSWGRDRSSGIKALTVPTVPPQPMVRGAITPRASKIPKRREESMPSSNKTAQPTCIAR